MKNPFSREICFWMVAPHEGKVKKLRLSIFSILSLVLVFGAFVVSFAVLAGDYMRVQLQQAEHFFSLQRIQAERDELANKQQGLIESVNGLKSAKGEAEAYKSQVKARLQELASILKSSESLGNILPSQEDVELIHEEEGVGGAEINCEGGRCSDGPEAGRNDGPGTGAKQIASAKQGVSFIPPELKASGDLLKLIDYYVDTLKSLPIGIPGNGFVSSGFGYRFSPFSHAVRKHEGVDFSLAQGAEIFSTADGIVREVKNCPTYGLMIDIQHGEKVITRYAHLSKAFVKEGDKVCRGEEIALAGSSGRSTGPHLHYEVLVDGKAQNPIYYLELAARLQKILL